MRRFKLPQRCFKGVPLTAIAGVYLNFQGKEVVNGTMIFRGELPNLALTTIEAKILVRRLESCQHWRYAISQGLTPRQLRQFKKRRDK